MTVKTLLKSCGAKFHFDERGNVAIIFGLTLVPAVMMTSFALDYARYSTARTGLQAATDAAALAVAAKMSTATPAMTGDQVTNMAKSSVTAQPQFKTATVTATPMNNNKQVCVNASLSVDNSLLKFGTQFEMGGSNMGYATGLTSSAVSCATVAGGIDPNTTYEIALVLDNSGSMSQGSNGQSKMSMLKTAATSFVNTVYGQAPAGKVKMSITPFNAAVVAIDSTVSSNRSLNWIDTQGNSSLHWSVFGGSKAAANADGFTNRFDIYAKLKSKKSTWDWNGCFEPQPYPMDVNDTPPTVADADTLFVPYLGPDEPNSKSYLDSYINDDTSATGCGSTSNNWTKLIRTCKYKNPQTGSEKGNPNGVCSSEPSQVLMRLTTTQATVASKINNLVAGGTTNLHDGFMWGWRTLSPNAPFADARAYNTVDNRKVMVFMSDGFNNWRSNPGTVTGSDYEILGYYSLNGAVNKRLPDGSNGDHVNYQAQLALAGPNNWTDFHPSNNYNADWSRRVQDELTAEACTNAKAKGIEVYTIGFTIPNDPIDSYGLKVLKDCATDANHYFEAKDANELNAAFATIGSGQGVLRLVAPPTTN